MFTLRTILLIFGFTILIVKIGAPPVDQKKPATPTPTPEETASQEAVNIWKNGKIFETFDKFFALQMYNVEYERYLQEVVQLLESDDGIRKYHCLFHFLPKRFVFLIRIQKEIRKSRPR